MISYKPYLPGVRPSMICAHAGRLDHCLSNPAKHLLWVGTKFAQSAGFDFERTGNVNIRNPWCGHCLQARQFSHQHIMMRLPVRLLGPGEDISISWCPLFLDESPPVYVGIPRP